ncbi:MAG: crossover junction endodeoxyribonuclease RuvC [Bryobacteraceae bacterium]|nr:crossover junction endodeoxyribonuclease RuvC [Bryobacteraceae bacterium]
MRVLGIDCGSQVTGYGVIDTDGTRHKLVETGVIRTEPSEALPRRLLVIGDRLKEIIAELAPDEAAVEDTFHNVNARSALRLTHVRGVVLYVAAQAGLPCGEYAPAAVKRAVVGNGRAEKEQVEWMVRVLLGLTQPVRPLDASDALAVAICHAANTAVVGVSR